MGKGSRSSDGIPLETKAFWECVDTITKSAHPFVGAKTVEAYGDEVKAFNPYTATTLWPPLVAIFRIAFALARPFAPVVALAAGFLGIVSLQTAFTAAAVLFGTLCVLDYQFRLAVLGIHSCNAEPGIHAQRTPFNNAIIERVAALKHGYKGTPWLLGGDIQTLYPYFAFMHADANYQRRWLPVPEADGANVGFVPSRLRGATTKSVTPAKTAVTGSGTSIPTLTDTDDEQQQQRALPGDKSDAPEDPAAPAAPTEAVALDFAVPEEGHDPTKPLYIVLHGLNGGSKEPYILDFVQAAIAKGSTVCVMVARGLMSTPVVGESLFHGARTSDVEATVAALRSAVGAATPLALVGFSMGGIIALNYIARAGKQCPLSSCITIAGSFDTRTNMSFWHSRLVWQPLLGLSLKENFVMPHVHKLKARGMDAASLAGLKDVIHFDTHMVAKYHRYEHVMDYYEDMSAGCLGKELQIAVPTLAIHACDDPLMAPELPPTLLGDSSQNENVICLMTKTGGHVGWAQGWMPTKSKWEWSSTAVIQYSEAVLELQQLQKQNKSA